MQNMIGTRFNAPLIKFPSCGGVRRTARGGFVSRSVGAAIYRAQRNAANQCECRGESHSPNKNNKQNVGAYAIRPQSFTYKDTCHSERSEESHNRQAFSLGTVPFGSEILRRQMAPQTDNTFNLRLFRRRAIYRAQRNATNHRKCRGESHSP
jgi:hypothetical protein